MHNRFEMERRDDDMAEVIQMTDIAKRSLGREQKDYFHNQAAYWDEVAEIAQRQLDYAKSQREYALQMLGMLPKEGGYPE